MVPLVDWGCLLGVFFVAFRFSVVFHLSFSHTLPFPLSLIPLLPHCILSFTHNTSSFPSSIAHSHAFSAHYKNLLGLSFHPQYFSSSLSLSAMNTILFL